MIRPSGRKPDLLRFRMRPFGRTSYYDAFHAVGEYKLADMAARIRCPMLLSHFSREQGADGRRLSRSGHSPSHACTRSAGLPRERGGAGSWCGCEARRRRKACARRLFFTARPRAARAPRCVRCPAVCDARGPGIWDGATTAMSAAGSWRRRRRRAGVRLALC